VKTGSMVLDFSDWKGDFTMLQLVGLIIFLIGIIIFTVQNQIVVAVRFLNWVSPEVSLAVVVLVAISLGAIVAFFLDSLRFIKMAKKIKELKTTINQLQRRIDNEQAHERHSTAEEQIPPKL
jgi:uncharacterized integral membrane protein